MKDKFYFVTLIPADYYNSLRRSQPRCLGFSDERPDLTAFLAPYHTEGGFHRWAVVEEYPMGFDRLGRQVQWAEFKDGRWSDCPKPEFAKNICNWAGIG